MTESNTTTITPKALATELDTDAKTCRRFLRSLVPADARPGKGSRWAIDAAMVPDLKVRFADYTARKAAVLTADSLTAIADEVEVDMDEALEVLEDLVDGVDEDIAELEDEAS